MKAIVDDSLENIIFVQQKEIIFFENFLASKNIKWNKEYKENGIIVLSKSLVGYISTPIRKINLSPKFREVSMEHILRLYYYVYGYNSNEDDEMLDMNNSTQFTNLIEKFINLLTDNISIGILREYKTKYTNINHIRGNVNYRNTYINSILQKKNPVDTSVSILSLDNYINMIIVGALKKISEISKYSSVSTEILSYFDDISIINTTAQELLENIVFNSNTKRYEQIVIFGSMIYDNLFFDSSFGSSGGESFIINYDLLFEKFIQKILVEQTELREFFTWNSPMQFAQVYSNDILNDQRMYQPDILFKYNSVDEKYGYTASAFGIIDVKNKAYSQFRNADIYQMVTYSSLLHSEKNILVYPSFRKRISNKLIIDTEEIKTPEIIGVFINIIANSSENFIKDINVFINDIYEALDK